MGPPLDCYVTSISVFLLWFGLVFHLLPISLLFWGLFVLSLVTTLDENFLIFNQCQTKTLS